MHINVDPPEVTEYKAQFKAALTTLLVSASTDALEVVDLQRIQQMDRCDDASWIGFNDDFAPHVAAACYAHMRAFSLIQSTGTLRVLLSRQARREGMLCIRLKEMCEHLLAAEFGTNAATVLQVFAGIFQNTRRGAHQSYLF